MGPFDLPRRVFGARDTDYEILQEDGEFVLRVELPGYDPAEIDVRWTDCREIEVES
jgi:HSP20 family protein